MNSSISQTQLANFMTSAGVLAIILQKFGILIPQENIAFLLFAVWSVGWSGYNFIQRYKKGDITLGGYRKVQ